MRPPQIAEPPILTFRVRLLAGPLGQASGDETWREIELAANQRLAELGDAIPLAFAIERACPWCLSIPLADGPLELHSHRARAGRIALRDLPLPGASGRREFLFRLDDAQPWRFGVKLVRASPMAEAHVAYPRIVAMQGRPPEAALAPPMVDIAPAVAAGV